MNDNLWSNNPSNQTSNQGTILSSTVHKDDSVHQNVRCDSCHVYPLRGLRMRCLECKDFDYCENCFLMNRQNHNHNFNAMTKNQAKVHIAVRCDGCFISPIFGNRYKCNSCSNFDYCEKCFIRNRDVHRHNFNPIV